MEFVVQNPGRSSSRSLRMRIAAMRARDDGFGLLEVMVASGIILVALVSLAYLATSGFQSIAVARQRHAATALLDRTMEQIRALPYDTVKLGLRTSDLAGDPAVSGAGTAASPYRLIATNERIPNGQNGLVTPLVPNTTTTSVDSRTYAVKAYITYFNDDATSGAFRVTVTATWSTALGNPGTRTISDQTIIYSPSGCLSTATHPFSAPCQAFSYASAATHAGEISSSTTSFGATLTRASLDLGSTNSSMQIEQTSTVQGEGTTPGLTIQAGGVTSSVHHAQAATQSDNDPASPGAVPYQTATAASLPADVLTTNIGGNLLTLSAGASAQASSTSTVSASATNACANHAGTAQTDFQPCGRATARQMATLSSTIGLNSLGIGLGLATVAEVQVAPAASLSHTNRDLVASSYCTGTSGEGCVHAHATRTIGRVRLGGLPAGVTPPLFWDGYLIQLDGYSDTATAEAGINAGAPTVATTGTIRYWNGAGYTSIPVPTGSVTIPIGSVNIGIGLLGTAVKLEANLTSGGRSSSSTSGTCAGLACRTSGEAQVRSPLIGTVTLRVDILGTQILKLDTKVDLGSTVAEAKYSDAPTA
jgi:type II secretory pathway pseudopilin PulG